MNLTRRDVLKLGAMAVACPALAAEGDYAKLTAVRGELGPHKTQQRGMYPHDIPLDPQGRFFYVPCKGGDCVISYRLDSRRGVLVET